MKNSKTKKLTISKMMKTPFKTADVIVNVSQNNILREDKTYNLQPKILELLVLLCSAKGQTLSKQELISALWPDTVVGPDSLANSMARLRKALGDDAKEPKYIQTVQRKGYRWLQPVSLLQKSSTLQFKYIYAGILLSAVISGLVILLLPSSIEQNEPEAFLFPDLSIKKLPDGGYEIQAGIEGTLTKAKKAAMLKEIKRITGEENSGMEFTIDPISPTCDHTKKKDKNEKIADCIKDKTK
jgi:DNA-binding winged helix-turn-helix (wHTH) protein